MAQRGGDQAAFRVPDTAPCRAHPDLWFAEDEKRRKRAAAECMSCAVQPACLAEVWRTEGWEITHQSFGTGQGAGQRFGVWGGTTPRQRNAMARARKTRQPAPEGAPTAEEATA